MKDWAACFATIIGRRRSESLTWTCVFASNCRTSCASIHGSRSTVLISRTSINGFDPNSKSATFVNSGLQFASVSFEYFAHTGFFVPGIRPPSVPEGEALLRLSLSYAHTGQQIDSLVETMGQLAN